MSRSARSVLVSRLRPLLAVVSTHWPRAPWPGAPWGLVAALLFTAAFLSPQFVDGFGADDVLNSCIRGYVQLHGQTISEYNAAAVHSCICAGRFYPLALILTYSLHYFMPSATVFHAYALALVLADVALFYALLRGWRLSPAAATLGTLCLALSIQLRFFFDPVLQFAGLMPFMVGASLVALVAFQRALMGRRLWQVVSVLAFAIALLSYEIAYALTPVFVIMARIERSSWRRAVGAAQFPLLLVVACASFTLGIRYNGSPAFDVGYDPLAILRAAALQATGAIPTSYALLSSQGVDHFSWRQLIGSGQNWGMALAAGALTWACLRRFGRQAPLDQRVRHAPAARLLAFAGAVIWILPGLVLALAPKYQQLLKPGLAYLPVFMQYFGLAVLGIVAILWAWSRFAGRRPALARGLVALNACIALVTFDSNVTVARRINRDPTARAMILVETACRSGLCDEVPADATIWSVQPHAWMGGGADMAGGHFTKILGRRVHGIIGEPTPESRVLHLKPGAKIPPPSFVMNDLRPDADWGYVVLGAVEPSAATAPAADAATSSPGGASEPTDGGYRFQRFRLFLSGSYAQRATQPEQLAIVVLARRAADQPSAAPRQWLDLAQLKTAQDCGAKGVILEGRFPEPAEMSLVLVIERAELAARMRFGETLSQR